MTAAALPRPSFIDRDPVAVEREMISAYQTMTGRTLQPGQIESLLIKVLAYRETLVRAQIQSAAEQNLLAYAAYPMIDYLGELVGVTRLDAQAAAATMQFTLTTVQPAPVVIPSGTRIRTADGAITFTTNDELTIQPGLTMGSVAATADVPGVAGNGYLAGQVTTLLDAIGFVASVENVTESFGGADQESDDRLRERIRSAPEGFSVAGSIGAYRYHAMSVSSTIADVSVTSPSPGNVRIVALTSAGVPSDGLLESLAAALSDEKVRPLTDTVTIAGPDVVTFAIEATLDILRGVDAAAVMAAASAAAEAYVADRRAALGRDIVRSQIIAALSVPGVYRVTLVTPSLDIDLSADGWATSTGITLTQGAIVDG